MIAERPATSPLSESDDPDWVSALAECLLVDRQDARPRLRPEKALLMARRYAAWLEKANAPPGPFEDRLRRESQSWPGSLFFHTGKPTILVAPQGHGKTNTAAFLIQLVLRLYRDWDVYTNIPFPWTEELEGVVPAPPRLFPVHDAVGLMRGVANTVLEGRTPAAVLDETGQWLSSHDWRNDAAESMTKFTYVERHFRLRGPILVYHTWRTVLEPFRAAGDLRGSYCRVIKRGKQYRLARQEDQGAWWAIEEAALPFLTLGLNSYEMNLDFHELGSQLRGGLKTVARQTLRYLTELEERRAQEAAELAAEARGIHAQAIASVDLAVAEQHRARLERREEIIRAFMENPDLPNREAQTRFRASSKYLVELRKIAFDRLAGARPVAFPVSQEPTP